MGLAKTCIDNIWVSAKLGSPKFGLAQICVAQIYSAHIWSGAELGPSGVICVSDDMTWVAVRGPGDPRRWAT